MASIRKLDISTGVNLGGLTKGLGKATDKVRNFSMSVPKIAGGVALGNLLSSGVGAALGGIKSGLSAALSTGFNVAIDTEQTEIAFTTMLQSVEKSKALITDLTDFASSTPFQMPQVTGAAKNLLALGFSSDEVLPKLRQLGDISAGLGIDVEALAQKFGKAKIDGKLMSGTLNEFASDGIPIFTELGKVLGVSSNQIKDMASKGKIEFSHLEQVMQNLTNVEDGGQFAGLMEAQSKSTGGLISTLKDVVSINLGKIATKFIKTFDINQHIATFTSGIASLGPYVDWFMEKVSMVKPVFVGVFHYISAYMKTFRSIVGSVFQSIVGNFNFGSGGFQSFIKTIVTGLAIGEFAWKNWRKVLSFVVTKAYAQIVTFANYIHYMFTNIPTIAVWAFDNIGGIIKRAVNNYVMFFVNLGENIFNLFANLPGLIAGTADWDQVFVPMARGMEQVIQELPNLPERVAGDLEKSLHADADKIKQSMAGEFNSHIAKRLDSAFPKVEQQEQAEVKLPESPKIEVNTPSIKDAAASQAKHSKLAEVGSNEARATILRSQGAGFTGPDKEKIDLAKQQVELQKEQLAEIKKQRTQKPAEKVFCIA